MTDSEQDIQPPPEKKRKIEYNISDSFKCPITKEILVEPYILADTGVTYERSAIREWLHEHNTCPLSNTQLNSKKMIKNKILGTLIDEHIHNNLINNLDTQSWTQKKVLSKIESMVYNWELLPEDYLIQYFKKNNSFLNKQDYNLLTLGIQHGQEELTDYILKTWDIDFKTEGQINVKDRYYHPIILKGPVGNIHLFLAVTLGYEEIVDLFLNNSDIDPNYYNSHSNQTLLSVSTWYGDIGIVEKLLSHSLIDLSSSLINNQPQWVDALSNCAFHGYSPILNKLLSFEEVDPNLGDSQLSDQVPLIIAIERNNYEITKRLLNCPNINTDIQDCLSGDPLLHFSIRMRDYPLLEILLECPKIDLNEKNGDQMTILELIYLRDDSIALRMVLDSIKLNRIEF